MKAGNVDKIRAFIAYHLPLSVSAALHKKVRHHVDEDLVEALHWVAPQDYHLTLRFLGNCTKHQIRQITRGLHEALQDVDAFRCMNGEINYFPAANHPRLMALMVHSSGAMETLHTLCDELAVTAGVPSQSSFFKPHVTLARFSEDDIPQLPMPVWRLPGFRFTVREIALIRSDMTHDGSTRYSTIETFPLETVPTRQEEKEEETAAQECP